MTCGARLGRRRTFFHPFTLFTPPTDPRASVAGSAGPSDWLDRGPKPQ
jgi:hypothetical protein